MHWPSALCYPNVFSLNSTKKDLLLCFTATNPHSNSSQPPLFLVHYNNSPYYTATIPHLTTPQPDFTLQLCNHPSLSCSATAHHSTAPPQALNLKCHKYGRRPRTCNHMVDFIIDSFYMFIRIVKNSFDFPIILLPYSKDLSNCLISIFESALGCVSLKH